MAASANTVRRTEVLAAELTWVDGRLQREILVVVEDGVVVAVGSQEELALSGQGLAVTRRLPGCALLPGMVDSHSHSFQRGLRGVGERYRSADTSSTFWSWREGMYELVTGMDEERLYVTTRRCYEEMLAGGVTAVGEFHYLHHPPAAADFSFDRVILRAASDAGIR